MYSQFTPIQNYQNTGAIRERTSQTQQIVKQNGWKLLKSPFDNIFTYYYMPKEDKIVEINYQWDPQNKYGDRPSPFHYYQRGSKMFSKFMDLN